ncbi:MAG: hypothetical protein Q8P28_01670 [Deltaproteobacteria bacterium]|nr:hypothetical protein [Deltaproteobacteria bacterium]
MKKNLYYVFLPTAVMLISGCSHVFSPSKVAEIGLDTVGVLEEKHSVQLINGQTDNERHLIKSYWNIVIVFPIIVPIKHKHYANYKQWTDVFLVAYAEELAKRGVEVSAESPAKIYVKVSDVWWESGLWGVEGRMKLTLSSEDGSWSKEFQRSELSKWSANTALATLMHNLIKDLLHDSEIMDRMRIAAPTQGIDKGPSP